MRISCRSEGWPGAEVCWSWVPYCGRGGRGTMKIPWTDRERAWQGAHCICGMTFVVLSLATCDAIRWSLLLLSTVVIASVAAVARAWRFLCAGPKTSHASSVSRRSRAAEKLALSLVGSPLRVLRACARVRVNICHMALPPLFSTPSVRHSPLASFPLPVENAFFFYLLISIITCNNILILLAIRNIIMRVTI